MKRTPSYLLSIAAALVLMSFGHLSASAAGPKPAMNRALVRLLDEPMDMKDFQNPMALRDALGLLMEKFAASGKELPIFLDTSGFKEEGLDSAAVYNTQISFQPFPKRMRLGTLLELMLSKVEPAEVTYLVRDGSLVITTRKAASPQQLLQRAVMIDFDNTPFSEAMEELSALTGASIVMDNRLADKLKVPVTAHLRNDVTLKAALRMLADTADLKAVFLQGGIYVTDPWNAQNFEREMHERRRPSNAHDRAPGEKKEKGTDPK
jgi:hypothetical protein